MPGDYGISPRERELLMCLACGFTHNPEMGFFLGISPRTIKCHFNNIYRKMGIEGDPWTKKIRPLVLAYEHGLFTPEDAYQTILEIAIENKQEELFRRNTGKVGMGESYSLRYL